MNKIKWKKINLILEKRDEIPFCFLSRDTLEKIFGNIIPVNLQNYNLKTDFVKMCHENRLYELSLLINETADEMVFDNIYIPNHEALMSSVACENGCINVVKLLHEKNKTFTKDAMDNAAGEGHLGIVKFLHEKRTEGCTERAMDFAAWNGFYEMVEWLHEKRTEGCTELAIIKASQYGDIRMVSWLHKNKPGCSIEAFCEAEYNNHTEVIEFLKEKYPEKYEHYKEIIKTKN